MAAETALPDLSTPYVIAPEQVEQYRRDGHTCVRGIVSPAELAPYREAIVEATRAHTRETRPLEERDTYGKAFIQVTNLWEKDERVRRFVFARRFARLAIRRLGSGRGREQEGAPRPSRHR